MKENITVLLTCSGIGSRLGTITNYTNKSLVKIGKKPAIAYIIDSYPDDTEFIITIGHYGSHVKQYLNSVYSDKNIQFVDVDNYNGPKSSPVYSQLQTKEYLQKPFFYHSCDTITFDDSYIDICKNSNKDILIGFKTNSGQYDSFDIIPSNDNTQINTISNLYSKRESTISKLSYVGIAYINDYKKYWSKLHEAYLEQLRNDITHISPSDFYVYKELMPDNLYSYEIKSWYDVGNIETLNKARQVFPDSFNILYKEKESIFIQDIKEFNKKCIIKFFYDNDRVKNLANRAKSIESTVPKVLYHTDNFLIYEYTNGTVLSERLVPNDITRLLNFGANNMWHYKFSNYSIDDYKKLLNKFYIEKTKERINKLITKYNIDLHKSIEINNEEKFKPIDLLHNTYQIIEEKIKYYMYPSKWHGDFIPDNIIRFDDSFKLIDWRESFVGDTEIGDMYYDLAKLNHNLTINHKIIYNNNFDINITTFNNYDKIYVNILTNETMNIAKEKINEFIKSYEGINCSFCINDYTYIELLTGIVWLNMSPLHHNPFDLFLFYFGLWKLNNVIKKYYL